MIWHLTNKRKRTACTLPVQIVLAISIIFGIQNNASAQDNSLTRISSAERSDGKGYVIRFHLEEAVDSFRVYQPSIDLIQMTLFGNKLDTTKVDLPTDHESFDEISFYDIPSGIGVDIYLTENNFFHANAYNDRGSEDLLLGLTDTDKDELQFLTEELEPVIWSKYTVNQESLLVGNSEFEIDEDWVRDYEQTKNNMKFDRVVIDPGHGGHDPGSIGYKGIKEKDVVLSIAKKVGGYINEYLPDVEVIYTREDDRFIELEERGRIANKAQGDLFVSIHCNSNHSRQPYGADVFFLGLESSQSALDVMKRENMVIRQGNENEQKELSPEDLLIYELQNSGYIATSERLAGMIEYQLDERAKRRSRGVKQARFVVLYHASMPAVLIETGFISNPSEARYLSTDYGQSIIASAIFRAVRNYKDDYERSQHLNTK